MGEFFRQITFAQMFHLPVVSNNATIILPARGVVVGAVGRGSVASGVTVREAAKWGQN